MLQWMGGSRRKVATSRKSTQKRQKQYFEQRRRQQQHQREAADGGNYFEGIKTYGQQSENSRSLDILSLLNLSAVADEYKSSCTIAREKSDDALNYEILQHLPAVQSSEVETEEHSRIEEARTSSSYQMGIACPKTISISAPGNHAKTLKTDGDKMNQLKMAPDCQLSVIDILGYDEPISSCEKSLAHEAHVAFSIEGLGNVGLETPPHSPETHTRNFLHGCSSPSKATNIANSSNLMSEMVNLECELDAMMRNIDLPICRSSVEQPFCSKKRMNACSKAKQKLPFEEFSLFNDSDNTLHDLLGDDELFYGSKDRSGAIWNASGILADSILDESGFRLSDKNWMDPTYTSTDFLNSIMDCRKEHTTFEGLYQQENRTTIGKAGRLESLESPAPNFKYQKSENASHFTLPDMTWHSSIARDHDYRDLKDEVTESCFITADARESLSLSSEESCSSTAVRGKLERTLLDLKDKQAIRDSDDICHSESVCCEKNISPRERNCNKSNTSLKEHINGPEKFTRMSNPSTSIQVPQLYATSKKRLKPDRSRYFGGEFDLKEQTSGCNSFSETCGTTKHVSSGCGLWTEDLSCTTGDTKLCFEGFSKSSAKCSPCCNSTSEKHNICQPNLQHLSRSSSQNIFQVSTCGHKSHNPLDVHGCLTPEKENIARDAYETSGVQVSDHGKFQPQIDEFSGSKSLSSENGKSTDASDSEVKYRDCKERTCETQNMGESENETNCFQQAEDIPSLVTYNIFDGMQCNADRKCQFAQTSALCRTGFGDIELEDPPPNQRTIVSDAQSTADSTCQVMMFDSCVLQLLCVQVLKEVSAKVTGGQASQ